jgi:cytochrome b
MPAEASLPVWDRGIRLFHWLLLLAVTAAAVTGFVLGSTYLRWHLISGCAIAVLLLWRVVWGTLGDQYARFAGFAYPPRVVLAYLRAMRGGPRLRYLGHNPLGALMVFALLLVLTAIVLSGTTALGGMLKQGPLRAFLTYAVGRQVLRIHQLLAWLLLGMIAAHLGGVAFESWRERENLVRAMVTGRKPAAPPAVAVASVRAEPRLAARLTLSVGLSGAAVVAALAALPGRGVPPDTLDPLFAEQCGSCHLAFPPSLAPAATWNAILDRMEAHFGRDTGLPPTMIAQLRTYLVANSAEHWDTLPSWQLRTPDPAGSLRISATPGWRRIHRGIPASVFAVSPILSRSSCEACHADAATGLFAPQAIAIPQP